MIRDYDGMLLDGEVGIALMVENFGVRDWIDLMPLEGVKIIEGGRGWGRCAHIFFCVFCIYTFKMFNENSYFLYYNSLLGFQENMRLIV
jgi:hypothetical protein